MKNLYKKSERTCADGALSFKFMALMTVAFAAVALTLQASQPAWWASQGATHAPEITTNSGIVTTNYLTNNYAAVNQGQLKQFTEKAVQQLNVNLTNSGGAGEALSDLLFDWQVDYALHGYGSGNLKPNDYQAMNVGQLKYVGNMIWTRLASAGYTNAVPGWLAANTNSDYQVANIGQLKSIFNFDLSLVGPSGLTAGTNSGGTINLNWTLPGTNNATSYLVEQQNTDGSWTIISTLTNTSLTSYAVTGLATNQSPAFQIIAQNTNSYSSPVQTPADAGLIAPSNVSAYNGMSADEIDLSWVNNATTASYNLIEQSSDGVHWHAIATVSAAAASYSITGLTDGQSYYFGVAASGNGVTPVVSASGSPLSAAGAPSVSAPDEPLLKSQAANTNMVFWGWEDFVDVPDYRQPGSISSSHVPSFYPIKYYYNQNNTNGGGSTFWSFGVNWTASVLDYTTNTLSSYSWATNNPPFGYSDASNSIHAPVAGNSGITIADTSWYWNLQSPTNIPAGSLFGSPTNDGAALDYDSGHPHKNTSQLISDATNAMDTWDPSSLATNSSLKALRDLEVTTNVAATSGINLGVPNHMSFGLNKLKYQFTFPPLTNQPYSINWWIAYVPSHADQTNSQFLAMNWTNNISSSTNQTPVYKIDPSNTNSLGLSTNNHPVHFFDSIIGLPTPTDIHDSVDSRQIDGTYYVLNPRFKLINDKNLGQSCAWDSTLNIDGSFKNAWTMVPVGGTNTQVKLVLTSGMQNLNLECVVDDTDGHSTGEISLAAVTLADGDNNLTITGNTATTVNGSTGVSTPAKIVLRVKSTKQILATLNVDVEAQVQVKVSLFFVSDQSKPLSQFTPLHLASEIQAELNKVYGAQGNINFTVENAPELDVSGFNEDDGSLVPDNSDGTMNTEGNLIKTFAGEQPGVHKLKIYVIKHLKTAVPGNTPIGLTFLGSGEGDCFVNFDAPMDTYPHEVGHAMGLSTRNEGGSLDPMHDLGIPYWPVEFSDYGGPKQGLMYTNEAPPHMDGTPNLSIWIREADWSFVNGANNGAVLYNN